MKQLDFYNTPSLKGADLENKRNRAMTQQSIILTFLETHPTYEFTPESIHDCLFGDCTPLTSIRRACTNLEKMGKIIKTGKKRKGHYDIMVNTYVRSRQ